MMSNHADAADHWQLFLDDDVLARTTGFDRIIHHPRATGVVIPADRPWETAGVAPLLVDRRGDGSFFAYYTAMWWDIDGADTLPDNFRRDRAHHIFHGVAYAESDDGVHWHKPELGLAEAPAAVDRDKYAPFPSPQGVARENNLGVPFVVVADLGRFGNVSDLHKRYALRLAPDPTQPAGVGAAWTLSPRGYFASELPDFVNEREWGKKLLDSGGCFDPRRHLLHFWDDVHEEWVAMEQGVIGHWLPSREIARMSSPDLISWTSRAVLYPDAADPHGQDDYDEPMSLTPFCAERVVFGLLSWFHSDRTHPDGGPNLEPSPGHPHIWPWCRKGTCEMRITLSRDGGMTWDRTVSREPWIPHGGEQDSYDRLVIGALPPVRVGDEDWFYVEVIDGDHLGIRNDVEQTPYYRGRLPQHQIALYIQKRNRYVSLTARNHPEVLITKPITITGDSLRLNVDASRGEVRVGIAAAGPVSTFEDTTPSFAPHLLEQRLLCGLGFDDCVPVRGNSVEHEVRFRDGAALQSLRGQAVCLLVRMVDADLYGFRLV
ncbi:MAG: hypothetical protein JSV65_03310 [Armatimonadota bacterium]|nr:MAG: hypothetical protein JSV65_03310 [Armatimonadota bacterium]